MKSLKSFKGDAMKKIKTELSKLHGPIQKLTAMADLISMSEEPAAAGISLIIWDATKDVEAVFSATMDALVSDDRLGEVMAAEIEAKEVHNE